MVSVARLAGNKNIHLSPSLLLFFVRLKICRGCRSLYYCSLECQSLHWSAGHKKECKVLGAIHQDVKEEIRGEDSQASGGKMEPKQGSEVVEELVTKLKGRHLFFKDDCNPFVKSGEKKEDGDFMIKKFTFYTAFFSDEEISNMEESETFEEMETYFNLLVTKYRKEIGEMPKGWKGWRKSKGKKSKKIANKRRLRRKLL